MTGRIKRHHIVLMVMLGVLLALSVVYLVNDEPQDPNVIRAYDEQKDFTALVPMIRENLYWLSERPDFSPEKFLMWRAPNFDPSRKGQATIDVVEFEGQTAGFIAYYKRSPTQGFIWLFAVGEQFRRRGLGDRLMQHALKQLKKQGAQYVTLTTRLHKTPALQLYQKNGFVEDSREEARGLINLINRNP